MGDPARIDDWSTRPSPWSAASTPAQPTRSRPCLDDHPVFIDDIQRKRSHRSGMPSWSPPVRPPRHACRPLSAPEGATCRSQPPGLARDLPETTPHVASPRPMTPPSAAPLTCEDVWEREVLYCVVNPRRIDGKDRVGGSILGTATDQSGIAPGTF